MTVIFHVDIDAFFASAELLDHPEWKGKPVIVGALPGHRGVVSTCSYEARTFGVRSAMPVAQAYQLCPQGIFTLPRMDRYQELSRQVMGLISGFGPGFHQVSVDEAYLDMTGMEKLTGPPAQAGRRLKELIHGQTGLTVSVGIAPNHYLAKMGSDYRKPDGLYQVMPGKELDFLDCLPLKKLHGAGAKTQERLAALGITTIPELRRWSQEELQKRLGEASGRFLFLASRGQADYDPARPALSHSISQETTLEKDSADKNLLKTLLLSLSQEVIYRAYQENQVGRTACLKIRLGDFTTMNLQKTSEEGFPSADALYQTVLALFQQKWQGQRIRLIGVGLANLTARDGHQQGLFDGTLEKQKKMEVSAVKIAQKTGLRLTRASLLDQGKK